MSVIDTLGRMLQEASKERWHLDGTSPRVEAGYDVCTVHSHVHLQEECEGNRQLIPAAHNALPALLDVARAVRAYTDADPMVRGEAYRDLCNALAKLEEVKL